MVNESALPGVPANPCCGKFSTVKRGVRPSTREWFIFTPSNCAESAQRAREIGARRGPAAADAVRFRRHPSLRPERA